MAGDLKPGLIVSTVGRGYGRGHSRQKKDSIKIMKLTRTFFCIAALGLLFSGALAQAATVSGTVTNKTDGKPAAGDTVVLLDVQAGMADVAHATTDARGHYSLSKPGAGPYLIRVTHQGAAYFIAAPDGPGPGDILVYDSAAKVDGISIEADVLEIESGNGQLMVNERYLVHNTSSPPRTEYSPHGMEIVLPAEAIVDGAEARRPTGLPTSTKLTPAGQKGHFTFDFPIQPDDVQPDGSAKDTLFQITYHVAYVGGKFTFKPQMTMGANNLAVLLPKAMTFAGGAGAAFQPVPIEQQEPGIQTYLARNVTAGKTLEFTVSGTGSLPREGQGQPSNAPSGADAGGSDTAAPGSQPGGGIGTPINTPDPLSKYKWWILGGLALLLAAAAAFLLRKPAGGVAAGAPVGASLAAASAIATSPGARNSALLNVLKEELFSLETEKLSGTISPEDYAEVKAALEIVLKRALSRK
jgi:Carboxypeptidase regulatory-like domain